MDYFALIAALFFLYSAIGLAGSDYVSGLRLYPLCFAIFVGIGAYAVGVAAGKWTSYIGAYALGIMLSAIFATALAYSSHRLEGDYFSILTYLVQVGFAGFLLSSTDLTRGAMGISGIQALPYGTTGSLIFALAIILSTIFCGRLFEKSPYHPELILTGADRMLAESVGINCRALMIVGALFVAVVGAVSGGVIAQTLSYIEPSLFGASEAILLLSIAVFGAFGREYGAFAGAAVYIVLPELLRFLGFDPSFGASARQMVLSIALIAVVFRAVVNDATSKRVRPAIWAVQ